MKENILDVLGMSNTGFVFTDQVNAKMAVGYLAPGVPIENYDLGNFDPYSH